MANTNSNNCSKTDKRLITYTEDEQLVDFVQTRTKDWWELVCAETTVLNKRKQFFSAVGKRMFRVGYHDFNLLSGALHKKSDSEFVKTYEGSDLEKACRFYIKIK